LRRVREKSGGKPMEFLDGRDDFSGSGVLQ
jgi:hypothetical protein